MSATSSLGRLSLVMSQPMPVALERRASVAGRGLGDTVFARLAELALGFELERWLSAGQVARLWLRDDDAREATPALERMLALCARHDVPILLAVIPDGSLAGLQARLRRYRMVKVAQHGIAHRDRLGGTAPSEFAADMPAEELAREIAAAGRALCHLPGWLPVFVPAWNRVPEVLPPALALAGIEMLSAGDGEPAAGRLRRADVQIDLLRWKPEPRFAGAARLLLRLRRELVRRRQEGHWQSPIGVLTHHLVMDEASWSFLESLFRLSRTRPALSWRCPTTVFPRQGAVALPLWPSSQPKRLA